MTDPVGVTADPRPVLMMGDEPDTVAELMELADQYAWWAAYHVSPDVRRLSRTALERAIRAALEAQP